MVNRKTKAYSQRLRRRKRIKHVIFVCLLLAAIGAGILVAVRILGEDILFAKTREPFDAQTTKPEMTVALLTPNEYSRPQTAIGKVNGIVIHYTANPGTTAINNRDYFEGLKDSHLTYASSHFVVGIEGEIVQCIPTNEKSYASNERNDDTISIEVCHPDESGVFTDKTYRSLVDLTGWLCMYLDVAPEDVIRHYDVTGKICPKYFVDDEDAWLHFKKDIENWTKHYY